MIYWQTTYGQSRRFLLMLIFGLCDAKFASTTLDAYDVQLEIVNRGIAAVKGPTTTTNQIHRSKFVKLD